MSILHTLPLREHPVYKITKRGSQYCNVTDLLAALMGGPEQIELAFALTAKFPTLPALLRASDVEIQEVSGIGPALAARIKAGLELGRRLMLEPLEEQVMIRSPGDIASLLMAEMVHLEREHFVVLMLGARNQLLCKQTLYMGNGNSTHIRVCEVFHEPVRRQATAIVVAHNHPSGDPTPSPEDVEATRQIVAAGKLLDIELLDHIIVGHGRFVSLKERGLGFS